MKLLKQTFLTITALLAINMSFSQDDFSAKTKGTFLTNGSVFIFSTTRKVNDNKANNFQIDFAPRAAYFIMDNLSVGLELTITSNKETQEDGIFGDIESTTTGLGFGPFARYYFKNGFFTEALIGIGSQKTKTDGAVFGDNELKSSSFGFRVGAGYAFFLGEHVAIEPTINYSWEDINPKDAPSDYKETLSSIFLGIGISAYF